MFFQYFTHTNRIPNSEILRDKIGKQELTEGEVGQAEPHGGSFLGALAREAVSPASPSFPWPVYVSLSSPCSSPRVRALPRAFRRHSLPPSLYIYTHE